MTVSGWRISAGPSSTRYTAAPMTTAGIRSLPGRSLNRNALERRSRHSCCSADDPQSFEQVFTSLAARYRCESNVFPRLKPIMRRLSGVVT